MVVEAETALGWAAMRIEQLKLQKVEEGYCR